MPFIVVAKHSSPNAANLYLHEEPYGWVWSFSSADVFLHREEASEALKEVSKKPVLDLSPTHTVSIVDLETCTSEKFERASKEFKKALDNFQDTQRCIKDLQETLQKTQKQVEELQVGRSLLFSNLSPSSDAEWGLFGNTDRIWAVKKYRETKGCSFHEAIAFIESVRKG